ncbi:hypothetical protein [Rhodococcus gannanensis]|uniref:Uncharacterized protein n=1 Tax=Rhodococcus gannanensis TaxID=1960308 RepID=A0ABW4NZ93_9NOCA
MQFHNSGGDIDSEYMFWDLAGSDLKEIDRLMGVLGWRWAPGHLGAVDAPIWLSKDLAFKAFSNLQGVDDMSYVGAELGIAPA